MTWKLENAKSNVADECSFCDSGRATFILSDEIFGVVKHLCTKVKTEWQMLLKGEEREGNVVYFNDYYIPKQQVSSASVSSDECMDLERVQELGIIGTIHSHSDMGVFFSGVDHEHTNTSFIVNHIVCNNKGEYLGQKALTLPCGEAID
jgi:proteasome lid subunit RPN8/RPN11